MQVAACTAAAVSAVSNNLTFFDLIPYIHRQLGIMAIKGYDPKPVADVYLSAICDIPAGIGYYSVSCCQNRSAIVTGDIYSVVEFNRLPAKGIVPVAERGGNLTFYRQQAGGMVNLVPIG